MVFYLEACESGSMFDKKLKDNINGMSAWVPVCKAPPYFFSITYVY